MLKHALNYARKGYYVFPLFGVVNGKCTCGKRHCNNIGKHPITRNGLKDATRDPKIIKKWWTEFPKANIGCNLEKSQLLVLDLDRHPNKADGIKAFKSLKGENQLPLTPRSKTGGNGSHIFFQAINQKVKGRITEGVDVKADGGYVVLPPSSHESGKHYEFTEGKSLLELEAAQCPEWLLELILKSNPRTTLIKTTQKEKGQKILTSRHWEKQTSSAALIIKRCAWLRTSIRNSRTLSEPEWFMQVGLLCYTKEAPDIIYETSKDYPNFNKSETKEKINNWLTNSDGPPLCESIQNQCGDELCKSCPVNRYIKSPIRLGYESRKLEEEKIEPFPIEVLPDSFKNYAVAAANSIQCPVDYIVCSLLVVASTLIGGNKQVRVGNDWHIGVNIWMALVGSPSSKKSPAMAKALEELQAIELENNHEYQSEAMLYEIEQKKYEADLTVWKKNYQQGNHEEPPPEPKKPIQERLSTSDVTVEGLGQLFSDNPHGIGLITDELSGIMRSMNQYKSGKGSDRSHYLSMWNNASLIIDRKKQDPIIIPRSSLSILGGIQPDILCELSDKNDDGFKERFLFCFPLRLNEMPRIGQAIPEDVKSSLKQVLRKLHKNRNVDRTIVKLSRKAEEFFLQTRCQWHKLQQSDNFPTELEAYYGKIESYLGRLALILHEIQLAEESSSSETIQSSTIQAAQALTEYFINHATRAFGLVAKTDEEHSIEKTIKWIKKKKLPVITARDLLTGRVANIKKASEGRSLLQKMQDYGYGIWCNDTSRFIFLENFSAFQQDLSRGQAMKLTKAEDAYITSQLIDPALEGLL